MPLTETALILHLHCKVFAICDGLHENITLMADTVHRLASLKDYEGFVATKIVENQIKISDNKDTIDRSDAIKSDQCES
jgi:hypothetical protein